MSICANEKTRSAIKRRQRVKINPSLTKDTVFTEMCIVQTSSLRIDDPHHQSIVLPDMFE
jgi:hypothetical protein